MSDSARPFAITLDVGTSLTNEAGSWRTRSQFGREGGVASVSGSAGLTVILKV